MLPNLDAEQARHRHSNAFVAERLCITRQSYERKKKNGAFTRAEIKILLELYGATFEYLFDCFDDVS